MQAFTDLVGTTAVPAHAFDMAELTALETAAVDHGTSLEASEAKPRLSQSLWVMTVVAGFQLCC